MKCSRCGASNSVFRWTITICADNRRKRSKYLCEKHDQELNAKVLKFFRYKNAEKLMKQYKGQ